MVHGTELGDTRLGATRVALVQHGAGQETPRHGHDRACMHVVLRGLYVEHSPTGTVVACPGDVIFKQPEALHWNHFGSTGAESLRFQLPEGGDLDAFQLGLTSSASLEWALRLGRTLRARRSLSRASADPSPQARLLARLRRDFRRRLSIGELAGEFGLHRSHLTRQFARDFGCSPQAFVALCRAAWVAEEVATDGMRLAEIAIAAGFADESHCIRTFKRAFGTTPRRWSRTARW